MKSRKNWKRVYATENPFGLPQRISARLRECCAACGAPASETQESIRYLWIQLSDETCQDTEPKSGAAMRAEDWFNVIDEAVSLGARSLILTLGKSLPGCRMAWELTRWACEQHEIMVGLHVHDANLGEDALAQLRTLDPERTRLFIDKYDPTEAATIEQAGFKVYSAHGRDNGEDVHACDYPASMTYVGPEGSMFACGLVKGHDHYNFGSILEKRLDKTMADESLPHEVSPSAVAKGAVCNGCPPLMEKRLHERI